MATGTQADQMFSKERPIISRWGHPIADDYGYVDVPGWILRNYHKCGVTPLEMMFVTHVMAFKYDRRYDQPENAAKPSLPTIAQYMGRDTSNVRRLKHGLIKKGLLTVTSSKGKADEYNFAGLTNRCLQYELLERETPSKTTTGKNAGGTTSTPGKNTTPVPLVKIPAEDSEVFKDSESNTSLQPAAGASVAGASEVPDKAVEPASIKEGVEPLTPGKVLANAQRKRNLVYDAIAFGSYNIKPGEKHKQLGYIGTLAAGVKECTPAEHHATLAEDLTAMYGWYKKSHADLSAPAKVETLCKYLSEWRDTVKPAAQRAADPNCPHCHGDGVVTTEDDRGYRSSKACACVQEVRHA